MSWSANNLTPDVQIHVPYTCATDFAKLIIKRLVEHEFIAWPKKYTILYWQLKFHTSGDKRLHTEKKKVEMGLIYTSVGVSMQLTQ